MSKILYAAEIREDWGLFMPHLLRVARERGSSIHVLETSAPLGTGNFTSNPVQNEAYPLETPEPEIHDVNPSDRETAPDTAVVASQTNAYIDELVEYFRSAGIESTGDWQPDFNREHLGVYARQIGADTIAVIPKGFLAGLLQGNYVSGLEDEGLRVIELEEAHL